MGNTINQEKRGSGRPLVIPPEDMERISRMPIIPPINDMLIEDLSRSCTELFIPPYNPFIDTDWSQCLMRQK